MDKKERNGQECQGSLQGAPEAELVRWDQVGAERVSRGQALKQHGAVFQEARQAQVPCLLTRVSLPTWPSSGKSA